MAKSTPERRRDHCVVLIVVDCVVGYEVRDTTRDVGDLNIKALVGVVEINNGKLA